MNLRGGAVCALLLAASMLDAGPARGDSAWVSTGVTGRLIYTPDAEGDRVMDFSNVGYRGRGVELLPQDVATAVTVSPIVGDDTANIQAAIDQVAAMPLGANGYRGAVLLTAGDYDINDRLRINDSGIVLRGEGRSTSGTVLHGRGTGQRPLIEIHGSGSQNLFGSTRNMIDKVVPVGSRSFRVDSVSGFSVGDTVRVERPSPANWIEDLGMDNIPGEDPWQPGSFNLRFDRVITRIEGDRIFVDAPLPNSFEQQYGGGTIKRYAWTNRIENVGVENLRGDSDFSSPTDEDHAWEFVSIDSAQNIWVKDTTSLHFGDSAVVSNPGSKWVTVDGAVNLDPVSIVTGSRRYTYDLSGELELVTNSTADSGRHDFVNNSTRPPGPHVFHNSVATNALNDAGPHQRWATGTLFDNVTVQGDAINARNRLSFGTGHGWSGANMVIWNSTADSFRVQNPPTAQNWLIGSTGTIVEDMTFGPQPSGNYDSHGSPVTVGGTTSLYEAQMNDSRNVSEFHWGGTDGDWTDPLAWAEKLSPAEYAITMRDYLIGDVDDYLNDGPGSDDDPFIDPAWESYILSTSANPITGFDDLTGNQNVAFTFQHVVDSGERVVHASLALALKGTGGLVNTDFLRLFNSDSQNKLDFSTLGWDTQVNTSDTFVGVVDLGGRLDELQDGEFNFQLNDDTGLDWALYTATVATPVAGGSAVDAFIDQGGTANVSSLIADVANLQVGGGSGGTLSMTVDGILLLGENYTQASNGELAIELDADSISQPGSVLSQGDADLDGKIKLTLADGFTPAFGNSFGLVAATTDRDGMFSSHDLPELPAGLAWMLVYDMTSVAAQVVLALPGDFNLDGVVDAADYTNWRDTLNMSVPNGTGADADGDGMVTFDDYNIWVAHFGMSNLTGPLVQVALVPEPCCLLPAVLALLAWRRRSASWYAPGIVDALREGRLVAFDQGA